MNRSPISVHRAFLYAASLPGLGEWYAGARRQGLATISVLLLLLTWFVWTTVLAITQAVSLVMGSIEGIGTPELDIPIKSLGICVVCLYALWVGSVINAVRLSAAERHVRGDCPQRSPAWAAGISIVCPGAGQAYVGSLRAGLAFALAHFLATLATIPSYVELGQGFVDATKRLQRDPSSLTQTYELLQGMQVRLNFGFAAVAQRAVSDLALCLVVARLSRVGNSSNEPEQHVDPSTDVPKTTSKSEPSRALWSLGLCVLGWLCPGSGQLLQGRASIGWALWGVYAAIAMTIASLLVLGWVSPSHADALTWAGTFLSVVAIIESLVTKSMLRSSTLSRLPHPRQ